jgi:hypothetical protein
MGCRHYACQLNHWMIQLAALCLSVVKLTGSAMAAAFNVVPCKLIGWSPELTQANGHRRWASLQFCWLLCWFGGASRLLYVCGFTQQNRVRPASKIPPPPGNKKIYVCRYTWVSYNKC